jgi:hypothetical protein
MLWSSAAIVPLLTAWGPADPSALPIVTTRSPTEALVLSPTEIVVRPEMSSILIRAISSATS